MCVKMRFDLLRIYAERYPKEFLNECVAALGSLQEEVAIQCAGMYLEGELQERFVQNLIERLEKNDMPLSTEAADSICTYFAEQVRQTPHWTRVVRSCPDCVLDDPDLRIGDREWEILVQVVPARVLTRTHPDKPVKYLREAVGNYLRRETEGKESCIMKINVENLIRLLTECSEAEYLPTKINGGNEPCQRQ